MQAIFSPFITFARTDLLIDLPRTVDSQQHQGPIGYVAPLDHNSSYIHQTLKNPLFQTQVVDVDGLHPLRPSIKDAFFVQQPLVRECVTDIELAKAEPSEQAGPDDQRQWPQ